MYHKIDLYVKQGSEFLVEVTAGKNLLRKIVTENNNGILDIKNDNSCNFVRGYEKKVSVTVTVPRIDRIENHGVGTARFDETFTQDTIFILAENSGDTYLNGSFRRIKTGSHGNGDIYISGSCDTLLSYTYGTNSLYGKNLQIKTFTFIEHISIGDVHINAPEGGMLEYKIWKRGNIFYRGNPAAINDLGDGTASGKLYKEY